MQSEIDIAYDGLYKMQVMRSRYVEAYRYLMYRVINIGFVASRTPNGTNDAAKRTSQPTELLPFPSLALPPLPPFPSTIESNQRAEAVYFSFHIFLDHDNDKDKMHAKVSVGDPCAIAKESARLDSARMRKDIRRGRREWRVLGLAGFLLRNGLPQLLGLVLHEGLCRGGWGGRLCLT
ncbi:hypothetical protein BHE74_00018045 [Ensete ventricosum]|nr:hypothetical protein BHE74_00018045 [Ensete ventricosum]